MAEAAARPDQQRRLRRLKLDLNAALHELRKVERAYVTSRPQAVLSGAQLDTFREVVATAATVGHDAQAHISAVRRLLEQPLHEAEAGVHGALAGEELDPGVSDLLLRYAKEFRRIDALVLPLAYPDLGEVNAVKIWRISPRERAVERAALPADGAPG